MIFPPAPISALSPENWPFSLELLPPATCLVGGAVRDALLGRKREYLDLDFVTANAAIETASKVANHYKAGFVVLDASRQIARVVFAEATVDFAQQEGESLETDLHRRDFTINAIAYNPFSGEIIDFLGGYADLQAGVLRMISAGNLEDDPLRLLRAYRQASQLGFTIEPATRTAIRERALLLGNVAAERVRAELAYLLPTVEGTQQLQALFTDGLLGVWLAATEKDVSLLPKIDEAAILLKEIEPKIEAELAKNIREGVKTPIIAIAKLVCLLGFEEVKAEEQLLNLKYSRVEMQAALAVIRNLPVVLKEECLSIREEYFLFKNLGSAFPVLAVVAVALGVPVLRVASWFGRFINPDDRVAHPKLPVSGNDLMKELCLSPSPQVGVLLTEISISVAEGRISNRQEALEFASDLLKSHCKE
ncbi:CCA tRNA nucleotidyltransferase [Ancylothrix sp. C2]|uniref:CCA tRNA nucleotidyltransferase n=1 Tax=Ancylothrix sp. D3o TaxID=2953691 RepID=UPI0021BABDA0|nr:CCA tRNA nucleotidyltransferase [Ancylothrix sp. D3o]MCT7950721.1 CCA tRNA nucleotidyltransferase [Ancylothrix sp. D3o]